MCPNCTTTAVTHESRPHTEFHNCRGLKGIIAPMVHAENADVKVEAFEREDYIGGEVGLRRDGDNRPIMAVRTTRADGSYDTAVMAPTAVARAEEM